MNKEKEMNCENESEVEDWGRIRGMKKEMKKKISK